MSPIREAFVGGLARRAGADGGVMVLSTPNRTPAIAAGDDHASAKGWG